MNVAQLVQFIHSGEHLADVEPRMLLLQHSRVVEECSEVASRDVLHGEVHVLRVLEGI